jgi:hypothetical protein
VLSFLKKIAYVYPFSTLGSLAAIAGVYLFIVFVNTANPMSLVFSVGFIATLAALTVMGRLYARRARRAVVEWDSSQPLTADSLETGQSVNMEGVSLFPFFNLHFQLTGALKVGRGAYIRVREEHPLIRPKAGRIPVPLYFPLAGVLNAKGRFFFRDILGLTRTNFGREDEREISVLPPGVPSSKVKEIVTNQGFEDSIKKRSQDEERYFMREYVPGDRIRDINWKASARLNELITKIAPVTQEQTKTIAVFFRNLRQAPDATLESVVHLNRLKSLLLSFLRHVKSSAKEYVFQVVGATGRFLLETEEDIERFGVQLAGWDYAPAPSSSEYDPNIGEMFVFTTQYDRDLAAFLALFERAQVTAVQTVSVNGREREAHALFRLFVPFHASLVPGRFAFAREARARVVPPGPLKNVVYERDPIEIRLT